MTRKYLISILVVVIAVFAVAILIYKTNELDKDVQADITVVSNEGKIEGTTTVVESQPPKDDIKIANINNDLGSTSIPILMYHHIRDYNNPEDKIGTNLSVSPKDFSNQLDLIIGKGYTPITFSDLVNSRLPEKPILLTFDDGYKNFYDYAYPELRKRSMSAVSFIIVNNINNNDYMRTEEITKVFEAGIEIGSHTMSHPDLAKTSDEKANAEIVESKRLLEQIIQHPVISFCYPSGKFSISTENILKKAGYNFAVTTKPGITTFTNKFELNRYRVNKDTNISTYLK